MNMQEHSSDFLSEKKIIFGLGDGDSMLIMDLLSPEDALTIFDKVKSEIRWNIMMHRGGPVPRLVCMQGKRENGCEPIYRHPADEQPAFVDFTPTSEMLCKSVENIIHQKLNHALIQYYKGGDSYISEHSDKTLDVQIGTPIVNLSLGATRTMILKPKNKGECKQKIKLPHNSLFVMGWNTNKKWLHSIKRDGRPESEKSADETAFGGERISYTFRTIGTFATPDGKLFGQGAKCKNLEDIIKSDIAEKTDDSLDMLKAFSIENHDPDFDWDLYYGKGFDSINFKTLSGV
jgi:alkylated DNA repair dioxygenase AlkB